MVGNITATKLASKLVTSLVYKGSGASDQPTFVDKVISASNVRQAYGVKRLISGYSGPAVRVRRSSDNTEQDIAFSGTAINEASLLSFVGTGSGFVVTWYDQSGNGDNLTQATSGKQPRIVNSGVYDGALIFDGVDDAIGRGTIVPINNTDAMVFARGQFNKSGTGVVLSFISSGYANPSFDGGWAMYYDPRTSGVATPAYSVGLTDGDGNGSTTILENFGFSGAAPDLSAAETTVTLRFQPATVTSALRITLWAGGTEYSGNMQSEGTVASFINPTDLWLGNIPSFGIPQFPSMRIESLVICAGDQISSRAGVESIL